MNASEASERCLSLRVDRNVSAAAADGDVSGPGASSAIVAPLRDGDASGFASEQATKAAAAASATNPWNQLRFTADAHGQYLTEHPYGRVTVTLTGRPAASSASACGTYCVACAMSAVSALGMLSIPPA